MMIYCNHGLCVKQVEVSDDVFTEYVKGKRAPWMCEKHSIATKIAELRYATPLAFCMWLQRNFDRLVLEINAESAQNKVSLVSRAKA